MDLLPLSLARRLEVFPRLPETEVVRFALEVAAALSIAHADGVVHRDIKPDNVMLGGNGEAIVADFGLAGAFAKDPERNELASEDPGKVMGTPHYFSPEQARGLDLDGRTDLYSLGVMCYRAATGALPFEGDDWYTVARQHVEDTPVPPRMLVPELSEGFEAIVLRLLAKNPEERFASATQLADALLTLPTAPASRSVGVTPSSASVTQVAFPYLYSAVGKRSWKRNALLGAFAITLTAVVALFASPMLRELGRKTVITPEGLATTPISLDTSLLTKSDSLRSPNTAITAPVVVTKPLVKPAGSARPQTMPTRVDVTVTVPDSVVLRVNDELKESPNGTWEGYLPTGREQRFVARHERATPGCKSAQIDTGIIFTTAQASVDLDVGTCSVLLLTVKNSDNAVYTITGLSFPFSKTEKFVGTPLPIVLRDGDYALTVHSEKCSNFTIKPLIISRDSATALDTIKRSAPLDCPRQPRSR